ncbi:MAG: hypothetical protein DSY80_07300 [Desulfocapsa sp.]|nr:MAG: hypothetical protein DSY80_07300 [Desulfocapsa sp.]
MLSYPVTVLAVDVAPRISDREIIESLADLRGDIKEVRAGQKALAENMNQRFVSQGKEMNQRFVSQGKEMNQRFTAIDQRFTAVDQRFDSIDKRLSFFQNLMLVLIAGVFGLIGYIVWDRKTALRPLEQRMIRLETEVSHDLELHHDDGSRLSRLVGALRELAKTDKKVEAVLRTFSLL